MPAIISVGDRRKSFPRRPLFPLVFPDIRVMSAALISAAGMRVIKRLVGRPPRSTAELIDEIGVTRTAITEQLNELVAGGFVLRSIRRLPGRGRPRHYFTTTPAAMVMLFANNQQLVVPAMWEAINQIAGPRQKKRIVRAVSRKLAAYYRAQIKANDPKKRLEQFARITEEEGGMIDVVAKNGQVTVTKRTCPFFSMADEPRHVCEIDHEMISQIAGCPMRLVACRQDGAPCCQFEAKLKPARRKRQAPSILSRRHPRKKKPSKPARSSRVAN